MNMRKKERLMKVQCREKRLAGKRESSKKRRATENQETREKRLACQQEYYCIRKNVQMKVLIVEKKGW